MDLEIKTRAAICVLAKALIELLKKLSIIHFESSSTMPNEALVEIFKADVDWLHSASFMKYPVNVNKIMDSNHCIKYSICIDKFDVTLAHAVLTLKKGFITHRTDIGVSCKNGHGKCCSSCDHKCSKCNKKKCNKKCCTSGNMCNHDCQSQNCSMKSVQCKELCKVCCRTCKLCFPCSIKSSSDCPLFKLNKAVDDVNALRNVSCHTSKKGFEDFEKRSEPLEGFESFMDWKSLSSHIKRMLQNLLSFMEDPNMFPKQLLLLEEEKWKLIIDLDHACDDKICDVWRLFGERLYHQMESEKKMQVGEGEEPCEKIRVTIEGINHDGCLVKLPHQGTIKNVKVKRNSSIWEDINFIEIGDVWLYVKIKLRDEEMFRIKVRLENGEKKEHILKSDDTKFVSSACHHESSAFNIGLICHTTGLKNSAHSVISNLDELDVVPPNKVKYYIHGTRKTVDVEKWHHECEKYVERNYSDESVIKLPIDYLQDTLISRFANVLADWSKVKETATTCGLVLTDYDTYKHAQFLGYDISDLRKYLHLDACVEKFDNRILVYKPASHIVLNIRVLQSDDVVLFNQTMCVCADDVKLQAMLHKDITCDSDIIFIGLVVVPSTDSLIFQESICKPCLKLLLSYDDLKDLSSFKRWEKKHMVCLVEDLQKAHGLKKNVKNAFWRLYSCRIIGFMATADAFFPSIRAMALQSLAADVSTQVKTVLLTKEQQEVICKPHKKLIPVGSFGSGKSILGQLKVEQLYERAKEITTIYYICCESQSLFESTMKRIANRLISRGNNSYVDIIAKSLAEVQNYLHLDKNAGISEVMKKIFASAKKERVHFVFDEYDAEKLDKVEATSINNVVKTDSSIVHDSSIMLITQSLEKHREYIKTDAEGKPVSHKHEKYQFDLTGFVKIELLHTMRTTKCINKLTKICIEKISVNANIFNHPQFTENEIRDAKHRLETGERTAVNAAGSPTKKAVPVQSQVVNKQSKRLGEFSKAKSTTKERNFQVTPVEKSPDSATAAFISSETVPNRENMQSIARNSSSSNQKVQQDSVVKHEHNSNASTTESKEDLQNLDVLFKLLDVNDNSTNEKTRTNFKFKGTSNLGHDILGDKPVLIQLDTNSICRKQESNGIQTFKSNWKTVAYSACLLSILVEYISVMKSMVVLCYDQYAVAIAEELVTKQTKRYIRYTPALNLKHKLKSKDDILDSFKSTDVVLITDFMGFIGMEADKVLVFVDKSDHFLNQHLVESLGRCTDKLVIVEYDNPLTEDKPNETLEEIIKEWKDNELVHNVYVEGMHGKLDEELLSELSSNESKTRYSFNSNSSYFEKLVDLVKIFEDPNGKLLFYEEMTNEKKEQLKSILRDPFREDIASTSDLEKLQWDRDFLPNCQFAPICGSKPGRLPDIDIVLNQVDAPTKALLPGQRISASNDFIPQFMRSTSGGRSSSGGRLKGGQGGSMCGGGGSPQKVIQAPQIQKIESKNSEKPWVRPSKQDEALSEKDRSMKELVRNVRSILNKLTPQKFKTLVDQMLDLKIDNAKKLEAAIDLIFEKAVSEPRFSFVYANLCRVLTDNFKAPVTTEGDKSTNTAVTFRKVLLNKCQKEFEKESFEEKILEEDRLEKFETEEEKKAWKDQLDYRKVMYRRRQLGNIKFVGELFNLKMISEIIMHDCVLKFLQVQKQNSLEDQLECVSKLLTTIGKELDHIKAKPRMDQYFVEMRKILKKKKISSRVKFVVQDVMDLRLSNWVPRRDEENPKTIDEMRRKASQKKRLQRKFDPGRVRAGRDGPAVSSSGGFSRGKDGETNFSNRSRRVIASAPVDNSKFRLTKEKVSAAEQSSAGFIRDITKSACNSTISTDLLPIPFKELYQLEVKGTFFVWENSEDFPDGKGVALSGVKRFLGWLRFS